MRTFALRRQCNNVIFLSFKALGGFFCIEYFIFFISFSFIQPFLHLIRMVMQYSSIQFYTCYSHSYTLLHKLLIAEEPLVQAIWGQSYKKCLIPWIAGPISVSFELRPTFLISRSSWNFQRMPMSCCKAIEGSYRRRKAHTHTQQWPKLRFLYITWIFNFRAFLNILVNLLREERAVEGSRQHLYFPSTQGVRKSNVYNCIAVSI